MKYWEIFRNKSSEMKTVFYIPPECKINQETQGLEITRHFLKCPDIEKQKFVQSDGFRIKSGMTSGWGGRIRTCE